MFCASAKASRTIIKGIYYSGISCKIPYYGANAGSYSTIENQSKGVEGLNATAQAGVFAAGSGQLEFRISGTADTSGLAKFDVEVGGFRCQFSVLKEVSECADLDKLLHRVS
jgi:hypothetical protein